MTPKEESIECPYCDGFGYTVEHANTPHVNGECDGACPVQEPCGYCLCSGRVTTKLMKEHIAENKRVVSDEDDLPF